MEFVNKLLSKLMEYLRSRLGRWVPFNLVLGSPNACSLWHLGVLQPAPPPVRRPLWDSRMTMTVTSMRSMMLSRTLSQSGSWRIAFEPYLAQVSHMTWHAWNSTGRTWHSCMQNGTGTDSMLSNLMPAGLYRYGMGLIFGH